MISALATSLPDPTQTAMSAWWEILTFRSSHNTNVVLSGTALLGVAAGAMGTFLLLRGRALVADALSHAALPGVCVAFLVATALGSDGRSLAILLPGAALFGLLGVGVVQLLMTLPRVKEDAAIGVVLSVFFALGVVLLSVIQKQPGGNSAGLNNFIFGQAATMQAGDRRLIAVLAGVVLLACMALYKEFRLLCFDRGFARGMGYRTGLLDGVLLALLTILTIAGLNAVGAILMVALLIIPPAAARFWSDRLLVMIIIAAVVGGIGCFAGASASAVIEHLPTGPAIVVACGSIFVVSLVAAPRRGLVAAGVRRLRVASTVAREHVLRALYEHGEIVNDDQAIASRTDLLARRGWSDAHLRAALRAAIRRREVRAANGGWQLSPEGLAAARTIVRGHRLWEYFLSTRAGIAPTHVDRDADDIEHVLGEELVDQLEADLRARGALPDGALVPRSVHTISPGGTH
ncbi:MAG: metal ABC transporter permease [Planctomycetota bacterium]